MAREDWDRAEKVLCVRLDTLGDVLMTTPALRALKHSGPGRRVTLLTSRAGAEVVPLIPEIDDVIVYDAPWLKSTAPRTGSRPEFEMIELLRGAGFDAAAIFTVYSQNPLPSAFMCALAGIPLRLAHCHENPYQLLSDWVPDPEPAGGVRHEVRRQLDLVATVGAVHSDERLSLCVPQAACERVRSLLQSQGIDQARPWAVIHPGASAPSRRYPPESFALAGRSLALALGWQVVFTGVESEAGLVESIREAMAAPSHSLAGQLSLADMAALVSLTPLLIANNTGPVHMAAAMGTPVVDLYALTNPQHTPWQVPSRVLYHDVPCRYCYKSVCPQGHHNCLRLVSPQDVVSAAWDLWNETHAPQATGLSTPAGEG